MALSRFPALALSGFRSGENVLVIGPWVVSMWSSLQFVATHQACFRRGPMRRSSGSKR